MPAGALIPTPAAWSAVCEDAVNLITILCKPPKGGDVCAKLVWFSHEIGGAVGALVGAVWLYFDMNQYSTVMFG